MTNKECVRNCMFAVDGVCRLKDTHAVKQPECPYREGSLTAFSVC